MAGELLRNAERRLDARQPVVGVVGQAEGTGIAGRHLHEGQVQCGQPGIAGNPSQVGPDDCGWRGTEPGVAGCQCDVQGRPAEQFGGAAPWAGDLVTGDVADYAKACRRPGGA